MKRFLWSFKSQLDYGILRLIHTGRGSHIHEHRKNAYHSNCDKLCYLMQQNHLFTIMRRSLTERDQYNLFSFYSSYQ